MSYLGRGVDKISNIETLDNITFNGASSYTLQKGGVNFVPTSAAAILISIDGVVQSGNFSVSSSTIDFGTAVAGTSTCNFIIHLGTGVLSTPSDGSVSADKLASSSVTRDKLNLISDSSNPSLIAKGDGGSQDGYIQLNCRVNSHGIKLKSPPHSASASYTLTFPNSITADQFLKTDGSGNLSFASAGGANTPSFRAKSASGQSVPNTTHTTVVFGTEIFDTDNAFASNTFTVPSGKAGKYWLYAQAGQQAWSSNRFLVYLIKNGALDISASEETVGQSYYQTCNTACIADLAEGDAITVRVYHDNGSAETLSTSDRTCFEGFKLI